MIDFRAELDKLLARESKPLPQSELMELAVAGRQLLQGLNKKQTDISMQIEEIYDMAKESDTGALQEVLRDEKERTGRLVHAAIGLCDLIDDFCEFARCNGSEDLERQALLMWKNAGGLLEKCGIARLGDAGQPLALDIHSVQSGAFSPIPREHVLKVLQNGYRYQGAVIRKAVVVVSMGMEESGI